MQLFMCIIKCMGCANYTEAVQGMGSDPWCPKAPIIKYSMSDVPSYKQITAGTAFVLNLIPEPEKLMRSQVCTDFQSASLLRGTNLQVQFLLFISSNSSCGQLLSISDDLQDTNFNASLGTKIIIHGFRYKCIKSLLTPHVLPKPRCFGLDWYPEYQSMMNIRKGILRSNDC